MFELFATQFQTLISVPILRHSADKAASRSFWTISIQSSSFTIMFHFRFSENKYYFCTKCSHVLFFECTNQDPSCCEKLHDLRWLVSWGIRQCGQSTVLARHGKIETFTKEETLTNKHYLSCFTFHTPHQLSISDFIALPEVFLTLYFRPATYVAAILVRLFLVAQ